MCERGTWPGRENGQVVGWLQSAHPVVHLQSEGTSGGNGLLLQRMGVGAWGWAPSHGQQARLWGQHLGNAAGVSWRQAFSRGCACTLIDKDSPAHLGSESVSIPPWLAGPLVTDFTGIPGFICSGGDRHPPIIIIVPRLRGQPTRDVVRPGEGGPSQISLCFF